MKGSVQYNSDSQSDTRGLQYLEYNAREQDNLPEPKTLPTLIAKDVYDGLLTSEPDKDNPYLVTEAIDFPTLGSGGIYTKSFFESFLGKVKDRPIGGNKKGHWDSESINDIYLIGGKIEANAAKKDDSGTVYFKILVPAMGAETSNAGLIRDFKAKIPQLSLVTRPQAETSVSPLTGETITYFTASLGHERNDVVPEGAMKQRVSNSAENQTISKGGNSMNKEEALKLLAGLYANGLITMKDVARGVGSTAMNFIKSDEDEANAAMAREFNALLGDDPLNAVKQLLNDKAETEKLLVEQSVIAKVGPAKVRNAAGDEEENPCYIRAFEVCQGKSGKALQSALNSLENDVVMKKLRGAQADMNSQFNRLEGSGSVVSNNAVLEV
jgi:hypothetical protein